MNKDMMVYTEALTRLQDWIAFLEDCEGEGHGEPEEMIEHFRSQANLIMAAMPTMAEA
jgi:hypothetical protein|tara:strand:+ start:307 stop:480 length:174 start_codon:yes stop_codon:yes gene_type:complete